MPFFLTHSETPASPSGADLDRKPIRACNGPMPQRIYIVEGDITKLDIDAIVNAANKSLLGGGGVDGAIHRAAGPELRAACAELGEDRLLADCYRNSFALAHRHGLASIAYPAISTGAYGFPPDRAAGIALRTVLAALDDTTAIERVVFCCFGEASRRHHEAAFA